MKKSIKIVLATVLLLAMSVMLFACNGGGKDAELFNSNMTLEEVLVAVEGIDSFGFKATVESVDGEGGYMGVGDYGIYETARNGQSYEFVVSGKIDKQFYLVEGKYAYSGIWENNGWNIKKAEINVDEYEEVDVAHCVVALMYDEAWHIDYENATLEVEKDKFTIIGEGLGGVHWRLEFYSFNNTKVKTPKNYKKMAVAA